MVGRVDVVGADFPGGNSEAPPDHRPEGGQRDRGFSGVRRSPGDDEPAGLSRGRVIRHFERGGGPSKGAFDVGFEPVEMLAERNNASDHHQRRRFDSGRPRIVNTPGEAGFEDGLLRQGRPADKGDRLIALPSGGEEFFGDVRQVF